MDWPQVAQGIAESGAFVLALVLAIGGGIRNRKLAQENKDLRKAQRDPSCVRKRRASPPGSPMSGCPTMNATPISGL
jgi:hypothetical protein